MDTFFEQIVPVKKTAKEIVLIVLLWFLAVCIVAAAFLFLGYLPFVVIIAGFAFYGAFRLSKMFFIEFEYIVTNTTLDVDKIVAKSSRKRMVSIEIPEVTQIEKYNPNKPVNKAVEELVLACDPKGEGAYVLTVKGDKSTLKIVIAPNEKIKEAIKKSLPKYIANSAFREI